MLKKQKIFEKSKKNMEIWNYFVINLNFNTISSTMSISKAGTLNSKVFL